MKVIMCSRTFPAYHPKAGELTFFQQKIWASFDEDTFFSFKQSYKPKYHTIRAGNRWKVGDMASLRYWDGKPYKSKQVEFAQVEIKQIFNIKIESDGDWTGVFIDDCIFYEENKSYVTQVDAFEYLSKNDGLTSDDLKAWFKMPLKETFTGQIICWSDKVNY